MTWAKKMCIQTKRGSEKKKGCGVANFDNWSGEYSCIVFASLISFEIDSFYGL